MPSSSHSISWASICAQRSTSSLLNSSQAPLRAPDAVRAPTSARQQAALTRASCPDCHKGRLLSMAHTQTCLQADPDQARACT